MNHAKQLHHGVDDLEGRSRHRRRGSMYVVVLGATLSVFIIGLSALTVVRIERRSVAGVADLTQARLYAQAAIEMGFFYISDDPSWRDNRPHGTWVTDEPIGDGTFSLEVIDPDDDDLALDPNNFVVLTGIGVQGGATFRLKVTIAPLNGGYEIVPGSWRHMVDPAGIKLEG